MKKFRKIQDNLQSIINNEINILLKDKELDAKGIVGFIADVKVGRARYSTMQFTVPLWTYTKKAVIGYRRHEGYFTYYVAHELSHLLAYKKYKNKGKNHGEKFYEIFKIICPSEYQYFELYYKPSAKKYGINKK